MVEGHYLLLGTYSTPQFRCGDRVRCDMRGEVEIVGMTEAPISWPIGKRDSRGRNKTLVLCGDLVKALRRESTGAVCYWWGVSQGTVRHWRLVLGIEGMTEGTRIVLTESGRKVGVARRGYKAGEETRQKMSEAKRKSGFRPLPRGRSWTPEEDALLQSCLSVAEVAAKTGRTLPAVYHRCHLLGLTDETRKAARS